MCLIPPDAPCFLSPNIKATFMLKKLLGRMQEIDMAINTGLKELSIVVSTLEAKNIRIFLDVFLTKNH